MWRFDLLRPRPVVRLSRESAQWWGSREGRLHLEHQVTWVVGSQLEAEPMACGLKELLERAGSAASSMRRVDVVIESAWLPVFALPTSREFTSRRLLLALLRQRVTALQDADAGSPTPAADAWALDVWHRAGDAWAFGYALPSGVRQAIDIAASRSNIGVGSIQPALTWGWEATRPDRASRRRSWWCWLEQDRTLVAHVRHGHMAHVNVSGEPLDGLDAAQRMTSTQALSLGLDDEQPWPVQVSGWKPSAWRTAVPSGMPITTRWVDER